MLTWDTKLFILARAVAVLPGVSTEGLEEVPLLLFTASAYEPFTDRALLVVLEVLGFELPPLWLLAWCFFLALRKQDFSFHEYFDQTLEGTLDSLRYFLSSAGISLFCKVVLPFPDPPCSWVFPILISSPLSMWRC